MARRNQTLIRIPALRRLFASFSLCLVAWNQMASEAADMNAVFDGWFAAQKNVQTWKADFIQTRSLKALSQPLMAAGRAWVVIPDRFRWELGQPAQTIALRQPGQLLLIYPLLKRAEKYPLDGKQSGPWRDALALLEASFPRSRAELQSRFRVQSVVETNATLLITLQPLSPAARRMMRAIHIGLRANDFSLLSTELTFSDGSTLRNDFTNAILNAHVDPVLFDWEAPSDFKVTEPLAK
jgi:outer membrane lipoprotein-sorting protein